MKTRKTIGAVYFVDDEDRVVGQVRGSTQRHAYAMAAAPDMLQELEHTLNTLKEAQSKGRISQPLALYMIERLEAAIAKGRGEVR